MQIVFTDPPPLVHTGRSKHPWHQIAAQLQARPGEWALVLRDMYDTVAGSIRKGRISAFPLGHYEATTRLPAEKRDPNLSNAEIRKKPIFDLYIRYIPEAERAQINDDNTGSDNERD